MKILIYYFREIIFIFICHKCIIKTKYLIHSYHCNTRFHFYCTYISRQFIENILTFVPLKRYNIILRNIKTKILFSPIALKNLHSLQTRDMIIIIFSCSTYIIFALQSMRQILRYLTGIIRMLIIQFFQKAHTYYLLNKQF